jgi:hypothetical protein
METKYVWDIAVEKAFSKKQLEMIKLVSNTISHGGNIMQVQRALKQLNFSVK